MRHRNKGKILDRLKAPREALLRSLATSVILFEKVRTTEAKAKAVKSLVDKLVTLGKKGDVNARRKLAGIVYGENVSRKLIEVIGPRYKERNGGYTRITHIARRVGDGAKVVQIELV